MRIQKSQNEKSSYFKNLHCVLDQTVLWNENRFFLTKKKTKTKKDQCQF